MSDLYGAIDSQEHFNEARRQAFLNDVLSLFNRESNELLPYHEISNRTAPEHESYRGLRTVPLDRIVGSLSRFEDFDRNFLPRNNRTMARWKSIDRGWHKGATFPPVELIRVGDVYFVKDGNHRVSVAREHGQEFIDADVVEEHIRAPLRPGMSPEELVRQAEYAEFLRRTNLDRLRPDHDIRPSGLGDYEEIWRHIGHHRHFLEETYEGRPVSLEEAVTRWYDRVYTPLVEVARKHDVRHDLSRWTEADVYLWLMARRDDLYARYTQTREPRSSAEAHVQDFRRARRKRPGVLGRLKRRRRRHSEDNRKNPIG